MAKIIKLFPDPEDCSIVADCENNRNRDELGPPIGTPAWFRYSEECGGEDSMHCAFYITPSDIRCYYCHNVQRF